MMMMLLLRSTYAIRQGHNALEKVLFLLGLPLSKISFASTLPSAEEESTTSESPSIQ